MNRLQAIIERTRRSRRGVAISMLLITLVAFGCGGSGSTALEDLYKPAPTAPGSPLPRGIAIDWRPDRSNIALREGRPASDTPTPGKSYDATFVVTGPNLFIQIQLISADLSTIKNRDTSSPPIGPLGFRRVPMNDGYTWLNAQLDDRLCIIREFGMDDASLTRLLENIHPTPADAWFTYLRSFKA